MIPNFFLSLYDFSFFQPLANLLDVHGNIAPCPIINDKIHHFSSLDPLQNVWMKSTKLKFPWIKSFGIVHFCRQNIIVEWNVSRIVIEMIKRRNLRSALCSMHYAISSLIGPFSEYFPDPACLRRPSLSFPEESQDETSHRGDRLFQQARMASVISQASS